jgi:hypothetical protein
MRRPEGFPLFYDQVKGFDYNLYNMLQAEAEYFLVDALYEWIKAQVSCNEINRQVRIANLRSHTNKFVEVPPSRQDQDARPSLHLRPQQPLGRNTAGKH